MGYEQDNTELALVFVEENGVEVIEYFDIEEKQKAVEFANRRIMEGGVQEAHLQLVDESGYIAKIQSFYPEVSLKH